MCTGVCRRRLPLALQQHKEDKDNSKEDNSKEALTAAVGTAVLAVHRPMCGLHHRRATWVTAWATAWAACRQAQVALEVAVTAALAVNSKRYVG